MNNKLITILTIATALFLSSCEKIIEFHGEEIDPKLVVNSIVETGKPVKAYISKSYFFLDNEENTTAPDDVVPTLYVNDNRIGEMTPAFDTIWEVFGLQEYRLIPIFYNDYHPQIGDVVKIVAAANGYDDADGATSPLPNAVECEMETKLMEWDSYYYHPHFDDQGVYEEDSLLRINGRMELTFNISDPNPGKTNLFRLHLPGYNSKHEGENHCYVSFEYDDPIFGATVIENEFFDASDLDTRPEGVFTDLLFDGNSYEIKLDVYFEMDIDEEEGYDPDFFRFPFKLEHLSKEYYNYLYTCNQGDEVLQFFAEPIQTYSNVNGGFGLVGGMSSKTFWLDLPMEE